MLNNVIRSARSFLLVLIFALFLSTSAQHPAAALQIDVPLDQALVLAGGESTNPRSFDPATTISGMLQPLQPGEERTTPLPLAR